MRTYPLQPEQDEEFHRATVGAAAGIGLAPRTWTVERADASVRTATGPDGRTAEVTDHILVIRRTAWPRGRRPPPDDRLTGRPAPAPDKGRETTMPSTTRRRDHRRRDTPPPRTGGDETEILRGFLDYLRTSIAAKTEGAPEPQVRTAAVPSGTNPLGLLNHLTFVERSMFLGDDVTDWQATFQATSPATGVPTSPR